MANLIINKCICNYITKLVKTVKLKIKNFSITIEKFFIKILLN